MIPVAPFFLPLFPLIPALFFHMLPVLFIGPEMSATVMVTFPTVGTVFIITVVMDSFHFMSANLLWEGLIAYLCPWTIVVTRAVPAITVVKVIIVGSKQDIVGYVHRHMKSKIPGSKE
jgi:hypothetical protein